MWHEFSHVFLTTVWLKMKPNPMEDGNLIIFLENAMKIPWLELFQNSYHVPAWKTSKTWINDREKSLNLVSILTKLPLICDVKWHEISMRIHVKFFTGLWVYIFLLSGDRAFKIPEKMKELKCQILLKVGKTSQNKEDFPQQRQGRGRDKELKKFLNSIPLIGILVGKFHTFERVSTLNFLEFMITKICGLLISFK